MKLSKKSNKLCHVFTQLSQSWIRFGSLNFGVNININIKGCLQLVRMLLDSTWVDLIFSFWQLSLNCLNLSVVVFWGLGASVVGKEKLVLVISQQLFSNVEIYPCWEGLAAVLWSWRNIVDCPRASCFRFPCQLEREDLVVSVDTNDLGLEVGPFYGCWLSGAVEAFGLNSVNGVRVDSNGLASVSVWVVMVVGEKSIPSHIVDKK